MPSATARRSAFHDVDILMTELSRLVNSFKSAHPESKVKIGFEYKSASRRGAEVLKSTIQPEPQDALPGMDQDPPPPWEAVVRAHELRQIDD